MAGAARGLRRVAGRIWTQPFEKYAPEPVRGETETGVSIPSWPVGQDAKLAVSWEHGEPITIQEVYQRVNPAVVAVLAQLKEGVSAGTGVIFTEDGYILTNFHVIEDSNSVTVTAYDGTTYDATVVGSDESNDIAVLKVEAEGLTPVVLGDSDDLNVGDTVVAIGNPLGELTFSMSQGIVSCCDRAINVDGTPFNMIQVDASINPGNSGGPLMNLYGEVVGIVSAKYSSYSNTAVEGLGFAIPIGDVQAVITDIMENGQITSKPSMGITAGTMTRRGAHPSKWPTFVRLAQIRRKTAAAHISLTGGCSGWYKSRTYPPGYVP